MIVLFLVLLTVWTIIVLYLYHLDRKLKELESKLERL